MRHVNEPHPEAYDADARARETVARLAARDGFSRWLGIEVVDVTAEQAVLRMTVRPEMVNGFGTGHGGNARGDRGSQRAPRLWRGQG